MNNPDTGEKMSKLAGKHRSLSPWILGFSVLVYTLFLTLFNCLRYNSGANIHDIFIFESSFWNTLEKRLFWNFYEFGNHLGVHFSPGLFFLLPFYAVYSSSYTLLFLHSLFIAAAGIPLYFLSKQILKKQWVSLVVVFTYFCFAPTLGSGFSGFHESAFVLPFLFGLFWAHEKKKTRLFWLFVVLTLIWKESYAFLLLFFGLCLMIKTRTRKKGIQLTIFSGMWAVWSLFILMPLIRGSLLSSSLIQYRFPREIGHSFGEIAVNFTRNPVFFFKFAFRKAKLEYLLHLFVPLMLLPFASPVYLLPIIPQLAQNLLSRYLFGASLMKHYTAPIIPFLFYSSLRSLFKLRLFIRKKKKKPFWKIEYIGVIILALSIFMTLRSEVFKRVFQKKKTRDEILHWLSPEELKHAKELGQSVPEDATFAVSGHLAKYFARRKVICYVSPGFLEIFPFDYLLYYVKSPEYDIFRKYEHLKKMRDENYKQIDQKGRLVLYQRLPTTLSREQESLLESLPD